MKIHSPYILLKEARKTQDYIKILLLSIRIRPYSLSKYLHSNQVQNSSHLNRKRLTIFTYRH